MRYAAGKLIRGTATLVCIVGVGATMASAAQAAPGDPVFDSCFMPTATAPCTVGSKGAPFAMTTSPDGRFVYAANAPNGTAGGGVLVYSRNATTGALRLASCISDNGSGGTCATGAQGGTGWSATTDPAGRNVYVATGPALAVYTRNATTGALAAAGCLGSSPGCTPINGMTQVFAVVVSPDGTTAYARGNGALAVFSRNTVTGALTQKSGQDGCLTEVATAGCKDVVGLSANGFNLAIAPDGKYLYVPMQSPGGISAFERFSDGTLLQRVGTDGGCITTDGSTSGTAGVCKDGNDAMANGLAAIISPDGKEVFLGSTAGVFAFNRNPETGLLTEVDCITENGTGGCQDGRGVSFPEKMQVSADNQELILAGSSPASLAFIRRNPATGTLTQRPGLPGCITQTGNGGECRTLAPLSGHTGLVIANDGLEVYSASESGIVATFTRDFPPVCHDGAARTSLNTAGPASLDCSDPNRDALTFAITQGPLTGSLGSIDQANHRVFYNPFLGFTGSDSFRYKATARGADSNVATVRVSVAAPPAPPSGGSGGTPSGGGAPPVVRMVPAKVAAKWKVHGGKLVLTRLTIKELPRRWALEASCHGRKCALKTKKLVNRKVKKGTFNALERLSRKQRTFRAGQILELRISARHYATRVVRYKLRKNRKPKARTLCLPPGAKAPRPTCG